MKRRRALRPPLGFFHTLRWLLVGAALYALLLAPAMLLNPDEAIAPIVGPSIYLTPFFGLPHLMASVQRRGWKRRLLYFTLLLVPVHLLANYLAWRHGVETFHPERDGHEFGRNVATGAIGGFTGAALSFALLMLLRLAPRTRGALWVAGTGVAMLTVLAAASMAYGLSWTRALQGEIRIGQQILWYECVHLPWQALFAVFLAWLMRMRPRRAVAAPAP
ncbi:MAG: hypothetical protein ACOY45_08870 [Pseudomonadota bacterium]